MNRTNTIGSLAFIACGVVLLPACETTPEIPVSSATSRLAPPPLVSAPQELADSPEWVMVDTVRVEDSVRFQEYDPEMSPEALATQVRREIRDQVVDSQHFRVYGDFGEKSPQLARYTVRGTLRRLDIGPEFDADVHAGGAMTNVSGQDVQIQTVRPVTCELRLELIATDKVDPRIGLPGETVAIGNAEVTFNVGSKFSVLNGAGEGTHTNGAVRSMEPVTVRREQIPGCLFRTVRLALNDLLTKANNDVFLRGTRFAEEDRKAAEERKQQPQRASLPVRLDAMR